MKPNISTKLDKLSLKSKEIIKDQGCTKLKGGGYWCCTRNKWISN